VVSGGLACVAGVGLVALAFPSLMRFDSERATAEQQRLREAAAPAAS
jgi:hypothetical protein